MRNVLLASTLAACIAAPALADHDRRDHHAPHQKVVVVEKKAAPAARKHAPKVAHRADRRDVVVVRDWRARGLRHPGKDRVYVLSGGKIRLADAKTLVAVLTLD